MKLHIISSFEKKEFTISWLELNTPVGNFVIQPGHVPTVLTLSKNKPIVFELENGKKRVIKVSGGIAEITRTDATILVHKKI